MPDYSEDELLPLSGIQHFAFYENNCWDNAPMVTFLSKIKYEWLYEVNGLELITQLSQPKK